MPEIRGHSVVFRRTSRPVFTRPLRCPASRGRSDFRSLTALIGLALVLGFAPPVAALAEAPRAERLRVMIETDAGGDPDDEQSLVRFLLYCNEWDVEGIICTLPKARDRENLNTERTGLGIVRRLLKAYGECHANLVRHDRRFPTSDYL